MCFAASQSINSPPPWWFLMHLHTFAHYLLQRLSFSDMRDLIGLGSTQTQSQLCFWRPDSGNIGSVLWIDSRSFRMTMMRMTWRKKRTGRSIDITKLQMFIILDSEWPKTFSGRCQSGRGASAFIFASRRLQTISRVLPFLGNVINEEAWRSLGMQTVSFLNRPWPSGLGSQLFQKSQHISMKVTREEQQERCPSSSSSKGQALVGSSTFIWRQLQLLFRCRGGACFWPA